jgi:choline dehydrogenase-like flavoprotein
VRFKDKYLDQLKSDPNISLFMNANLTDIRLDAVTGRVAGFECKSYRPENEAVSVAADHYVLALGGIENPRALLNADSQIAGGLGNQSGAVGRYFMEHLGFELGYFVASSEDTEAVNGLHYVAATESLIQREKIGAGFLRLNKSYDQMLASGRELSLTERARRLICSSEILTEFAYWVRKNGINCTKAPDYAGNIHADIEQVPNPESRVLLTDERDGFGLRKLALDWRLSPTDKKTLRVLALELGRYFASSDLGRVKIYDWILDGDAMNFPSMAEGEQVAHFHHMGTTRMGHSASDGVVDRDCRVFGTENLYVAGSSVFRTGGYANPTYTIVQLALRLADHIEHV